jgi:hypothetical protein
MKAAQKENMTMTDIDGGKPQGKPETIRRIRLGDLQKVLRHRYRKNGCTVTEDDAGRDDLYQSLLVVSMGDGHERKMRNAIAVWAPWMGADEAQRLIDSINQTPGYMRKIKKRQLGEKLNLQNWEREQYGIRTIAPVDMTDEQLKEQRKAKDRARKWRKRRAAKKKDRKAWLANCLTTLKPWERDGIGRRQWERRRAAARAAEMSQVHVASGSAIKLNKGRKDLRHSVLGESQQRGLSRRRLARGRGAALRREQVGRKAARG